MKMVEIKIGSMVVRAPRNDIEVVDETPDGVCFKFKNGSFLYHVDPHMTTVIKRTIKSSIETYVNSTVHVDVYNYKMPVKVVNEPV